MTFLKSTENNYISAGYSLLLNTFFRLPKKEPLIGSEFLNRVILKAATTTTATGTPLKSITSRELNCVLTRTVCLNYLETYVGRNGVQVQTKN